MNPTLSNNGYGSFTIIFNALVVVVYLIHFSAQFTELPCVDIPAAVSIDGLKGIKSRQNKDGCNNFILRFGFEKVF